MANLSGIIRNIHVPARNQLGERHFLNLRIRPLADKQWAISGSSKEGLNIFEFTTALPLLERLEAVSFEVAWGSTHFLRLDKPLELAPELPVPEIEFAVAAPQPAAIIPEIYLG